MPYRVDVPRADDAVLDRLVELGALDVDRSPGGGIAALMPDSVAPDQVAYALGLDDLSIAPAIGRDTDSVWILTPRAIRIGRLRIVPADASAEPGVLRLTDSPAFGTGLHATTAMCLEVIDEALEHSTPGAVLDVGTGSGVLALAALLMGVPRALGLDIDAGALRAAAENARLNGLDRRLHLARGGPEAVTGAWPLVVANLLAAPLVELAPVLVRRVGHHGRLVLSGIPSSVEGDVDRTYRRLGMQHVRALHARGGAHSCWRHHGEWRRRCTGCTQPDWRGTHAAPPRRLPMGPARLSRRQFLTTTAATAALTAAGRAPAFAQGTRLHLLQWSHFVPAADRLFDEQAAEFGKQAGVQVQLERINQNDIQPRVTAAVQSGSGADIIILANNHPLLYESSLVDVTDVAEEIGSKQGGWHDYVKANCVTREKRWVAVPQYIISWAVTYREDWFKEAGFAYPKTWDEFRTVGRAMKAKGKPFGQAFGHSINDPNNWCYPLLWMWGGMEVQGDGRTVALSSKNAVEAVRFNTVLWKEVFDEGGLAWDDSNNNRAFLASEISLTGNAPSIYVAARSKFPDVYKGTNHGHFPPGPAGRFYWLPAWNSCVMRYSKQQKVAKDFIRFYMDRKQFDPYFVTMDTFGIPGTKVYSDHPLWKKDPRTAVFPETLPHARQVGYAGPAGRKATEALSKYIIVDMFAKAIQGMKPEDAVAWAAGELGKIYAA